MTAPRVIIALYFPVLAHFFAIKGISKAPGHHTISIFCSSTPWRFNSSKAPDNNLEQINSLTEQIQSMTQQINEMQNKITYYEKIIEGYDFENTLVVTFMYDDTVYDVVLCATGETVTVDTPTDTDYIKFKGWTVDGTTPIDLASYEINENTTISAILEYYQKVTYMVDDKEVYSKFVLKDSLLELIEYVPQKEIAVDRADAEKTASEDCKSVQKKWWYHTDADTMSE